MIEMPSNSVHDSYDIIFAGGGASACVTAGRLAAADPSLKILILEAGPHTREVKEHIQPARYFSNLLQARDFLTFHVANPSPALDGRSIIVPMGMCVGGGSSINFAMYTRASASDYDDWESVHGNPGWGSKDLIPLLMKAETYQPGSENGTHGDSGPLKISLGEEDVNIGSQFLAVAGAYDKERSLAEDTNDFSTCNVYARWPKYIDGESGRRSDTPHHYIYNQGHNKNLALSVHSRVVRVLFEGTRAVGVEYIDDSGGRTLHVQEVKVAHASRLVVISSGAFGSPALLERSGIGATHILEMNGIPQIVDLPGVGEHYRDHNLIFVPFHAGNEADTLDEVFRGSEAEVHPHHSQWLKDGKGLLSHNGVDAGIKIRPNDEDLKEIGPDFTQRWNDYFLNAPDKPVMFIGSFAAYGGLNPSVPRGKYFSVGYYTEYPVSTGRVHVKGGLDPYAPLDFEPGFLDDPADLGVLRWAYKKSRELARRMDIYRGELVVGHPQFPEGSHASTQESASVVEISAPDIVYTAEDDKAIDLYHRQFVETTWHSIGTCAMKSRIQGGVVDARLNVYGVQNLKVADCSIAPANVGSNTYNTAIAIGEKAAVIIAEELGIRDV